MLFSGGVSGRAERLRQAVREYGWDGEWFLMGYNDRGEKIGSRESREGSLYLTPQVWAVLAGVAENGNELMDLVEERLTGPLGTVLVAPAYSKGNPEIGLSSYMVKGCCENGAVYNHAVAFKMAADCRLGRAEQAYRSLMRLLPGSAENPRSGVEPYVVVNQYLGPENPDRAGAANGTWITGTAGWVYRVITEHMLGIRAGYDGLEIHPCLPAAWNKVTVERVYRNRRHRICFSGGQVEDVQIIQNPAAVDVQRCR